MKKFSRALDRGTYVRFAGLLKLMVPVAPAWDNDGTSSTEPVAKRERRIDLCYPALAARITQDAERLCSQQVSYLAGSAWYIQSSTEKKCGCTVDLITLQQHVPYR